MKLYAARVFIFVIFSLCSLPPLLAADSSPRVVSAQNGEEVTVPEGRRWVLTKESLQSKPVKLYVKGVFYLSSDVLAEITPPTGLAPSVSSLFGDETEDEVEIDIPDGAEYDIYFLPGARIRIQSSNAPISFSDMPGQ
ncbi:hypothetical protein [Xanthomonas sp. 3075]|uniref:hypothetical protein n=1 Tax=Xanthomonas sp. 3075 TaxID=3035315 RepID=UPI00161A130B|nr:hypothetical protein [Xanthomonas sp. 3075]MBB4129765.1 hypothetical protein [Xanthomonas sp. 3075]